jgi:hypothetical protein
MAVTSVSHGTDGSVSTSTKGVITGNNAPQQEGYHVRSGLHGHVTNDLSNVADTDLINIQGMEVTYKMAKEMGLVGMHKPDEGLTAASAAQRTPEVSPTGSQTGNIGYDATVDGLAAQVEAGVMKYDEASQYETALGQVALAGLTVTEVTETLDGIADGSIDPAMLPSDQRQVVENLETKVTEASTKSVMSEIGQEGFDRLSQIAAGDAEFSEVLRNYASMRALGKADHTWSQFLVEAEAWSHGQR